MATDPLENDIPRLMRKCHALAQENEQTLREEMRLRLKMYVNDQWDEREKLRRQGRRPMLNMNKCKPPVDQIENEIRVNAPGPVCKPVGDGARDETADIIAGMFRQIEYGSNASTAYVTAAKYSAASGYGVIEYGTRFVSDRSMDQELYVIENEDPGVWWFDPIARRTNREDAMWAVKGPQVLSKEAYEQAYGKKRKVLDRGYIASFAGSVQSMFGWGGNYASMNTWTTGGGGPYWVAAFWRVQIKLEKLTTYTDNIARFASEAKTLPPGVVPKTDDDGDDTDYARMVPRRTVTKYVCDACEVLDKTEWIGEQIPALLIPGPEVYNEGKLSRLSLIHGMVDSTRAFNYVSTSMVEIAGKVPRAPFIGTKGQFDDVGDDGINKWATANTEDHAWLAVEPVTLVDEVTGKTVFAPMPQRNMMEASIQWLLGLAAFFNDCIQAASATFDASLGKNKGDQSGKALQALQAESSTGNYNYADGLHKGIAIMYQQWLMLLPKIYDGPRAQTIIAADGKHEQVLINQLFDHPKGKTGADGKVEQISHNIGIGRYSVRVQAGASDQTRNDAALENLTGMFKAYPALLQIPGVAAAFARLLGEGNPKVDQIADMFPGAAGDETNPQQMQQQLAAAKGQNQQLTQALQQMHQAIQAQLPKLEADKFKALLDSFTKLEVARIGAGVDAADREAATLETMLGLAHDAGTQAVDHAHAATLQTDSQDAAARAAQTAVDNQPPQQGADAT